MIKATVKQENGVPSVELEFKGTTTEVLYKHALLTLTLLSRLTIRTKDPIERDRKMLRMLDALGAAVVMLMSDGAHTAAHCSVQKEESVVIDHATIRKMRNRGGDDNE